MRVIVVGLGIQGVKRSQFAKDDLVATVDPVKTEADFQELRDVPLDGFDAALVCTPDSVKFEILSYLLSNGKHVLVEKPLLVENVEQLTFLKKLSEKAKVSLYTAYNHRFEPHICRAAKVIQSGELGAIYSCRMFYGNGTARDVRDSVWRDTGMGVCSDIGSHLLDIIHFLFGEHRSDLSLWRESNFENKSCDHVVIGSESNELPAIQLEATLLSWRNSFSFDLLAARGSIHIDSLCKWGPSTFTFRKRVLPSGRPTEEQEVLVCPDPTWEIEYQSFLSMCSNPGTNIDNDIWIQNTLTRLMPDC